MHSSGTFTRRNVSTQAQAPLALGSKSLASMLPALLMTGVLTLVISAIMRLVWIGFNDELFTAWMEAWLTTWPIAFPIAYVSTPLISRFTRHLAPSDR